MNIGKLYLTFKFVYMYMTFLYYYKCRQVDIAVSTYIFESAFPRFTANNFEFLLKFRQSFDWCKCYVSNRTKHHNDKDANQAEKMMGLKHRSRKVLGIKINQ